MDTFQLVLYTSFSSRGDAIGLELIQCLSDLCSKHAKPNLFVHHSRLATEPKAASELPPAGDPQPTAEVDTVSDAYSRLDQGARGAPIQAETGQPRWDQSFFNRELVKYAETGTAGAEITQKIWVCGPPGMQESFDRAAETMRADGIRRAIHVL